MKEIIQTDKAPKPIGPYSQAVRVGKTVYLSGQISLDPETMLLIGEDIKEQTLQVLENLLSVAQAAGGNLTHVVKLTIFLTDLSHFSIVNECLEHYFKPPYPARATIGVLALPKGALVEMDAVMVLTDAE
jgi:reactive intermediate/imine deaminase